VIERPAIAHLPAGRFESFSLIWPPMNAYEKRNAIFGMEFDRYVPTHPSFAACIPRGAQIGLGIAPVSRDAEEGVERDAKMWR